MPHLLALDQGTTSSRAIVFDERGAVVAAAQKEITQHFPQPGWVEHDALEIRDSQFAVAREAMDRAGVGIHAIGVTNQRETTVVWDRATGRPIHRAIVWQDRRTADVCRSLDGAADVRAKTGLLVDAYFSATKVAWILDHVPGARAAAERGELAFGTVDSWLAWNLTEGRLHVTDASNAARTLLFDIHRQRWDDELLERFRVPRAVLPDVVDSVGPFGDTILGAPLAAMIGDQQSAAAGQGCFAPGLAKTTYGTGCFLLVNAGDRVAEPASHLLATVAWRIGGATTYAIEGSVFVGGAVVQWLRDGLGIIGSASEVERMARSVEDSGGTMLVPAFAGLGAPYWDPYARGILVGLTRGTTAAHIARAALEGIAYQVADLVDAAADVSVMRVDGGAAANDLLLQFQADILQRPVERPTVLETTALGAASLAGLATGVYRSPAEFGRTVDRVFEPAMDAETARSLRSRWRDAVERAKGWARE